MALQQHSVCSQTGEHNTYVGLFSNRFCNVYDTNTHAVNPQIVFETYLKILRFYRRTQKRSFRNTHLLVKNLIILKIWGGFSHEIAALHQYWAFS